MPPPLHGAFEESSEKQVMRYKNVIKLLQKVQGTHPLACVSKCLLTQVAVLLLVVVLS